MNSRKTIFKYKRIVSFILVITLVYTSNCLNPFNVEVEAKDEKVKVVKELTDERSVNSNTYLLSDGTKKTEVFLEDIRYKKDGKLVEYDSSLNTLDKSDKEIVNDKTTEKSSDYLLCNNQGKSKHFFPTDLNEDTGVLLNYKNYVIEMAPIVGDKIFEVDNNDEKIEYETPLKEMKYEYISLNNGVKENIVLNEKPEINEFSFNVNLKNLYLKQKKKDKGIFVYDKKTDNVVGYINPPNIKEHKGDLDYESVKYVLSEEDNKTILTIKVNEDYFDNKDLKYPVTIDPTAVWLNNSMSMVGVNSMPSLADSRFTSNPQTVSNKLLDASPYNTMETRLYLNTGNLMSGNAFAGGGTPLEDMYIESANLRFVESSQPAYYPHGGTVDIKRADDSWDEQTISWNNQPSISSDVVGSVQCIGQQDEEHNVDITDWVQSLSTGRVADNGLVFTCPNERSAAAIYGPTFNYVTENGQPYFARHMSISVIYRELEKYDASVSMDASFDDSHGKFEVQVNDSNKLEDGVSVVGYKIFARKDNSNNFNTVKKGDSTGDTIKVSVDDVESKLDLRVCIMYSDGTARPSDILSFKKTDKEIETTVEETTQEETSEVVTEETTVEPTAEEPTTEEEIEDETEEIEDETEETETEEPTVNLDYTYEQTTYDTDEDGLEDVYEIWDFKTYWNTKEANSDNYIKDTDGDDLPDGYEVNVQGSDPNDDSIDFWHTDSDNDGLIDFREYQRGTDPHLRDGDFDNYSDNDEQYPRKTGQRLDFITAGNASVYQSPYDRVYTEDEKDSSDNLIVTYTYIQGIYSGLTKKVEIDYKDPSLNKEMKYFYDKKGNRTAVVEKLDGQYSSDYPKTFCITYTYDSDNNVTYIASQNARYSMSYDNEGNMTDLQLDGISIVGNNATNLEDYQGENGDISNISEGEIITKDRQTTTYGNNQTVKIETTRYKRSENDLTNKSELIEVFYGNDTSPTYQTELNSEGQPLKIYDYSEDENDPIEYTYTYSENGTVVSRNDSFTKSITESSNEETGVNEKTISYGYKDVLNNDSTYSTSISSHNPTTPPEGENPSDPQQDVDITLHNSENYHYEVSPDGKVTTGELKDHIDDYRIIKTTNTEIDNTSASYEVDVFGSNNDKTFNYTYDKAGNIKEIKLGDDTKYKYEYDPHHRLTVEKDYVEEKISEYEYYITGNIINKKEYDMNSNGNKIPSTLNTIYYSYGANGWSDALQTYGNDTLTYDNAGNPLDYRDGMDMTWTRGRELSRIDFNDNTCVEYKYNKDGLRTYKNSQIEEVTYEWDEDKLIRETVKKKSDNKIYDIWYLFDYNDSPIGYTYSYVNSSNNKSTATIYYEKNIQGDIIGLTTQYGTEIAAYTYDAWGNITSTTHNSNYDLAYSLNHLSYRGYYRDSETGFYYLQSRYYDSVTMRFLNADRAFEVNTENDYVYKDNMYIYCNANPINNSDYLGMKKTSNSKKYVSFSYSRKKAFKYMTYYAIVSTHNDGIHGNNKKYKYHPEGDCANFVSQCLCAGGMKMVDKWHSYKITSNKWYETLAWVRIAKNREYILNNFTKSTSKIYPKWSKKKMKSYIKNHKPKVGDIIYFKRISDNSFSHAAIISQVTTYHIKFAAHTYSYLYRDIQERLNIKDYYYAEICHIKNSGKVHK